MSGQVETLIRGPESYGLARQALAEMEAVKIWPTPQNFELWLHALGDPEGDLSKEIKRFLAAGEVFTEAVSDALTAQYLPRGRLSDEIRDAGLVLNRELAGVSAAISKAHKSQAAYGVTLADAATTFESGDEAKIVDAVSHLTDATRKVQRENESLERRLEHSTREVASLREHLEQVRRDAMTDALTNLANRKAFDEQLEMACRDADQNGQPVNLALVDIDHFKRFNDTWGHQTGDQVLRYVASVLNRVSKAPRLAARYGGEEFALIFPKENTAEVARCLDAVRVEIASRALRRRSTDDDLGAVTISVGYASLRADETAASLVGRADAALYASKRGGRNRITCAESQDQPVAK